MVLSRPGQLATPAPDLDSGVYVMRQIGPIRPRGGSSDGAVEGDRCQQPRPSQTVCTALGSASALQPPDQTRNHLTHFQFIPSLAKIGQSCFLLMPD